MAIDLPVCSPFDYDKVIRLVGIDPGTNSLGVSVFERHIDTNEIALLWTSTIKGINFGKEYEKIMELNGERFAKVYGYKSSLVDFFNNWQPNLIVSEGNYMGRFPSAYGALTEMVLTIRLAALEYRSDMAVKVIDPSTVKKTIGVPGNTGDKELIKKRVKLLNIKFSQPQTIDNLDEHSLDSIAIGYWGISQEDRE